MTHNTHPFADSDGIVRDERLRSEFFKLRCSGASFTEVMSAMHAGYNRLFFSGQLQTLPFEVIDGDTEPDGRFHYDSGDGDVCRIAMHKDMFDWYEPFRDTLLHEMCHQYVRIVLGDITEESHGAKWQLAAVACGVRLPDEPPRY